MSRNNRSILFLFILLSSFLINLYIIFHFLAIFTDFFIFSECIIKYIENIHQWLFKKNIYIGEIGFNKYFLLNYIIINIFGLFSGIILILKSKRNIKYMLFYLITLLISINLYLYMVTFANAFC